MFGRKIIASMLIASCFFCGCAPKTGQPEEENKVAKKAVNTDFDKLSLEEKEKYSAIVKNAYQLYLWTKYDEAIEEFGKAGEIAETAEVYFNIATIYATRGDAPNAFINFFKVYQIDPDYDLGSEYARGFALGLYANGRYEDAIIWCDIALKKYYSNGEPGREYILKTKALAYRDLFQYDKALKIGEMFLEEYPKSGALTMEISNMVEFLKNNRDEFGDEAMTMYSNTRYLRYPLEKIEKFQEILEKYPETKLKDEIYYQIAKLYGSDKELYGMQDFESEVLWLERLIKDCPESPYVERAQKMIHKINYRRGETNEEPPKDDSWYAPYRKKPMPDHLK